MTKKDFLKFLKSSMEGIPIEKQEIELKKISLWTDEYLNKVKKNYTYCEKCKKYYDTKNFKKESNKYTKIVTTYTDCGYGDDDKIGEVEFVSINLICPKCGFSKEISEIPIRTLWEKPRK